MEQPIDEIVLQINWRGAWRSVLPLHSARLDDVLAAVAQLSASAAGDFKWSLRWPGGRRQWITIDPETGTATARDIDQIRGRL